MTSTQHLTEATIVADAWVPILRITRDGHAVVNQPVEDGLISVGFPGFLIS